MTLVKINPWFGKYNFENTLNNILKEISENSESKNTNFPKVDTAEDKNAIYLSAELPGLNKDEIRISLEDGVLTLRGEVKNGFEEDGRNYFLRERYCGPFERKFRLSDEINPDSVTAKFENGLLTIKIEKLAEEKKERIININ